MSIPMNEITEEMAMQTYEQYLEEGLRMVPPLKGYGMKFIQFAIDEPEMFRLLMSKKRDISYLEFMDQVVLWDRILPAAQASLGLSEADARMLVRDIFMYGYGLASVFASSACYMTMEEIGESLGRVCRGLMIQMSAPKDERVRLLPSESNGDPGNLQEYLRGRKNTILGYGPEKELFQIRIDAILYFEAVGENVFAYTKNSVYEIKQRLYQIEEHVKDFAFLRASKSLLVNSRKVSSIQPEKGGRGRIRMINDETVLASRSYYRSVVDALKNTAEK